MSQNTNFKLLEGSSYYVLPSSMVKVFPSTYRSNDNAEAKLHTEFNYSHIPGYNIKDSYIISWNSEASRWGDTAEYILKCVIHGYYFEIYGIQPSDSLQYVGISLVAKDLVNVTGQRTYTLKAFYPVSNPADEELDSDINGTICFHGLVFFNTLPTTAPHYYLRLTDGAGALYQGSLLPRISSSNSASGANAITLGTGTVAKKDNQVVIGKYNADNNNALFIIGNGTGDGEDLRTNALEVLNNGNSKITGALEVTNGLTIDAGGASITGTTISSDKLTVQANGADITGNVEIKSGVLMVAKKLTISSEGADITGDVTLSGAFTATGTADIDGKITGNNGLAITSGDTNLQSVAVTGTITSTGKLTVQADGADITGDVLLVSQKTSSGEQALKINSTGKVEKVDLTTESPTTNGKTLEYIDTISQDSIGKVSATKKQITLVDGGQGTLTLNDTDITITNLTTDGEPTFAGITTPSITGDEELTLNGIVIISDTTQATTSAGALKVAGGVRIDKQLNVGSNLSVNGSISTNGYGITCGSLSAGNSGISATGNIANNGWTLFNNGDLWSTHFAIGGDQGVVFSGNDVAILGDTNIDSDKSTTNAADLFVSGRVTAASFNATSDRRLKTNLRELSLEKSILDLPLYKYDFIYGQQNQIGCMAQDLQEICPELVEENKYGYLTIKESKLVYLLLDEVKKLKKEVEELKNK